MPIGSGSATKSPNPAGRSSASNRPGLRWIIRSPNTRRKKRFVPWASEKARVWICATLRFAVSLVG